MGKNLVIVESPAKAKTIEKFLGKDFIVRSSYGHIRDLAKKDFGIAIDNGFKPTYEISAEKKKVVSELTKAAKEAETVWLASDEDREGEAIAWHLAEVLKLPVDQTKRIVFHEITKSAIGKAIENPRTIDMNLVNAQQARRILDRLVGFELSPVLWRKVRPSLSAGRVQSVTVRLIVEREREIIAFESKAFYRVRAQFHATGDEKRVFTAELNKKFETKADAEKFLKHCIDAEFKVGAVEQKPTTKSPAPPFTTSTLQQEAARKLGMSVNMTMSTAQKLYENGHITYMRTDSVNLSNESRGAAKAEIETQYGEKYSSPRNFVTKTKGAQEAHEAIRPTYFGNHSIDGTPAEKRLYSLIWKRAVASQMQAAQIERTLIEVEISGSKHHFTAKGEVILFDGFLKLYLESSDDEVESGVDSEVLPALKAGNILTNKQIEATERFTQPPARYSEASLVKRLEELGIGRPSTYAPTITTIINRGYVVKQTLEGTKRDYAQLILSGGKIEEKQLSEKTGAYRNHLSPTDIGMLVNDYLMEQFSEIMDFNFTAEVEKKFDDIAEGNQSWVEMIDRFYGEFHSQVEEALGTENRNRNNERILGIDPKTGREISARIGRFGPMVQLAPENEESKPQFSSLKSGQLIATITLEDALKLFEMPRHLGEVDGSEMVIGVGRFGPYIKHEGKFTSLPKSEDPYNVTLERAVELVEDKKRKDILMKTPIQTFTEEPELQVLNGRYGPYIAYKGNNYRIPKSKDPATLTLDDCLALTKVEKKKKK